MSTQTPTLDLSELHVTRDAGEFGRPDVAALYLDAEPGFREVDQGVLSSLIETNSERPVRYCDVTLLEFQPDDMFMEETFPSLRAANGFIRQVLGELGLLDWSRCVDLPGRLEVFSRLIGSEHMRCRFEVLSGDSCSRFHVDAVHSRLICTYAGPGTQLKLHDAPAVLGLPSGTALIVKGTKFPGFERRTLHRSPPIEGLDVRRFMFFADAARLPE